MAKRLPWPRNADDHRRATIQLAQAIEQIADDVLKLREYDRETVQLALTQISRHAAHIITHQTLAKYGQPEEE